MGQIFLVELGSRMTTSSTHDKEVRPGLLQQVRSESSSSVIASLRQSNCGGAIFNVLAKTLKMAPPQAGVFRAVGLFRGRCHRAA